jgi:hypothetical protein
LLEYAGAAQRDMARHAVLGHSEHDVLRGKWPESELKGIAPTHAAASEWEPDGEPKGSSLRIHPGRSVASQDGYLHLIDTPPK